MKIPSDSPLQHVALVTGAGSGLGRATAKLLAHAGANVGLLGRTEEELEEVAEEINGSAETVGEAMVLTADVTDMASLRDAVAALESRWGRLDIVFANAGINGVWNGIDALEEDDFAKTIDINLTGTFRTLKAAVPLIRRGGRGGSIIITASVNGTRMFSNTGATAYASSKAGQVAMARMLAVELARDGIRVNTICPGAIHSEIDDNTERHDPTRMRLPVEFPDGKIPLTGEEPGTAGQVAEAVWFLASDASSHTTGTELFIDGAQSLFQG
ncbi:SDR family oxidoreductase [Actomonas aquatica]|uniref:SDR family NAD(P)-dependent oxidoreductase n=1 Tax=Actomonas aquatica TaxID=2866162 RepID=A0ABZ1C5W7_9BACT|nr:SDR family NAD(P)-dependent oxidoreductase [Opitutus sp. WL0086]WRQ86763.1 SDR family NAD(P)-dependent oxidoreductase [Opitutus sp. WL0086]